MTDTTTRYDDDARGPHAPPPPPAPASAAARPVVPARGTRRGAGLGEVAFDAGGFWGDRQDVNAAATLAHCERWMEELGWLENFDRVARGERTVDRPGWQFSDSEVYKLMEAAAWESARSGDAGAEALFVRLADRVTAAQDDDGYLTTAFGHPGLEPRYSDLAMGHELYNMGHLLQAAVARLRTAGADDAFVAAGRRVAEHVCREFGAGGRDELCGHPEIEVALAEFGRATGEPRYVEQARIFIERRGHGRLPVRPLLAADYFQDDVPVRDAEALRGHAVRALYLTAGAVDVAVDTGDDGLLESLVRQWRRTVERRTYLTGGMGSRHQDEGFGDDFELPADRAYCETCAGVASIMVSWRLYLATGEAEYADLIERTLYNVVAASPSADGCAFFYANPLHLREAADPVEAAGVHMRAEGGLRAPWFDVSCCPTNVARTLASLQAYAVSVDGPAALSVLQYAAGNVSVELDDGRLAVSVATGYPHDGTVVLSVTDAPATPVTLRLRVPHWARRASLWSTTAAGGARRVDAAPGWAHVSQVLAAGDEIRLVLGDEPRLTWPDSRIDAVRGTVAVERGPLVLCLESPDLPAGMEIYGFVLDASAPPQPANDGASVRLLPRPGRDASGGRLPFGPCEDPADGTPAQRPDAPGGQPAEGGLEVRLIPYYRWAERGPSTMRVFLPAST
ncbi:glycoside hydrolase family 127 protein [Zhihengliuella halotolerans]|uniref:Glycoside hydrolase family 127 protein n=1 Tax=Zhihengliuella halotolerans TaxID=370736 RepID=A0A4Q8AEP6_9MICC|nr:beta-L-arabinofuranosidase domain-containing protein [Zhihengliuella halotolerans]RZU62752.1 hypothetical protein EV380_2354 [Zhihengliuella halotolerans]